MRFHEPWSAQRTALNPTLVSLTGELTADESDELCARITRLLYSRQFCVYHSWQPGDFIIADNYSLLHTRQAFRDGNRELWRIHLN
jgi:alpha-ketoglutarate-dependent taurine dioxygenase